MKSNIMINYICGNCLFAEENDSSDVVYCPLLDELRKVNDYPCATFKESK